MASKKKPRPQVGLATLTVEGFKSIQDPQQLEFAPLTLLAGANSSGKSSMMQALLLLKQTLDVSYDPGPLLLNGPHAKFTSTEQLFSRTSKKRRGKSFSISLRVDGSAALLVEFGLDEKKRLAILRQEFSDPKRPILMTPDMSQNSIIEALPRGLRDAQEHLSRELKIEQRWQVRRHRCFLVFDLRGLEFGSFAAGPGVSPSQLVLQHIQRILHVPGLRATPERLSPLAAASGPYPGTFDRYAASVISRWKETGKKHLLEQLGRDLESLGLTWKVDVRRPSDTEVELLVGRLPSACRGGANDLVSIADVGFGVSQVLPVLVALLTAAPSQLVVLEQPELHLHPKAQLALAKIIARASLRGVRVVAETHSHLLLLGLQTLIARGELAPDLARLHWFERNRDTGMTQIRGGAFDKQGAFSDWPVDFGDVALSAESDFLDALES